MKAVVWMMWAGVAGAAVVSVPVKASAFCGFFAAKADSELFNDASRVVIARDGDRTTVTMSNNFDGEVNDFAMVIPVPVVVEEEDIHLVEPAILDRVDRYSAPRLVEYFDPDPCYKPSRGCWLGPCAPAAQRPMATPGPQPKPTLGVRVERAFTVGEYDIQVLSAEQSDGLEMWLRREGYRIPRGASRVLAGYIKQNMRFFVAKVNLDEHARLGLQFLRPIQVTYTSPKFMLPVRLGTVNARGPQELFVYTLTPRGRVETTNYRTVKMPTGQEIPTTIKSQFGEFYQAAFTQQVEEHERRAVFVEYAWLVTPTGIKCDPCVEPPVPNQDLVTLGADWGPQIYFTRLHMRYDGDSFPEDLVFHETGDRRNYQARYVIRHPFEGEADCHKGRRYREDLETRQEKEAETLHTLTGWDVRGLNNRPFILVR